MKTDNRSLPAQLLAPFVWLARGAVYAFIWVVVKLFYRVRVRGLENLPRQGPALLVCNHVSWLDGLFLYMHSPRPVRFLVWAPFAKVPVLRVLLKFVRAIPIAGEGGPRTVVQALRAASEALKNGEVVGIFAEGALTRNGQLMPFRRGFEQILKKSPAPVIPVALDRLWGSIFSHERQTLFWKWPKQIPYPVTLMIGEPMPATSEAWQVRQAVQKLLADAFNVRKRDRKPAHRQFVRMACRHPFRKCFIDPTPKGLRLKNLEVLTAATLFAKKLKPKLGEVPMVGVLLPTTVGGALANIALALLGKTPVNLNYTASIESILSCVKQCDIRHMVTARAFRSRFNFDFGPNVTIIDLEDVKAEVTSRERTLTFLTLLLMPGFVTEYFYLGLGRHSIDDLSTIIFSSGSTGDPKGVMLTQHNIVSNCEQVLMAVQITHRDTLLAALPFFHSFGFTISLWLPLLVGATAVYYPDPRQAKDIGDACREFKCTLFIATPTFLRFYIRRCEKEDFASIRMLITGAEKLPVNLAKEFEQKFGFLPFEGYGCTELSPTVSVNLPDVETDGVKQIGRKLGTIGQPLPGIAVKVVDPVSLELLPPNTEGMLMVYGPNVMKGYLHRPEQTQEAIRDGWYITGDLAKIDEDGFITITDRLSRFSKIAGEMVPHQRVEEEIHTILATTDRWCAVTGVPDEKKGEKLVVLHLPPTETSVADLVAKLNQSGLPNLWLPDARAFHQVAEMPVLGSGKLDLQKVKKLALAAESGTA